MSASELVTIGTLIVDAEGIVLVAQMPPLSKPDGSSHIFVGRSLRDIFTMHNGAPLSLLEEARSDGGQSARLRDGEVVRLFVRRNGGIIVLFLQEEILERNAAAHAKLRSTLGSVIAGFAHEVRNPISAIMSITESILYTPNVSEDILSPLSKIPHLVYRIEELLRTALSYGRPKPAVPQWHQLQTLLDDAIESLKLSKLQVDSWRIEVPNHPVLVDTGHASSILINLLTNALQASDPSRVSIQVCSGGALPVGFTAVDVIDRGNGIPENLQDKIFEPFFTTKAKGTGLGLPLARDLARMNGGDVQLLSSCPGRTVFRFLLRNRPGVGRADSQSIRIKAEESSF
jgi:signal transduction histidine kinase